MIPLNKLTSKVNPMLLNTLQQVYLTRTNVLNKKNLQSQNIDSIFNEINAFEDGKGITVLKKFDELFGLHQKFPEKQYELLNTSYTDSVIITSILEVQILIKEIEAFCDVLLAKENSIPEHKFKTARSNGAIVDMRLKNMFRNWRNYLEPFLLNLKDDIAKLESIPLGSNLDSQNANLNGNKIKMKTKIKI
jgi:hypothetical protein